MSHHVHDDHKHVHSEHCGHTRIQHDGHVDFLHDGHLHCSHDGHYDEHVLAVSATNPAACARRPATASTRAAAIRKCRTATTWIIWSMAVCTTRTATTATTTGRSRWCKFLPMCSRDAQRSAVALRCASRLNIHLGFLAVSAFVTSANDFVLNTSLFSSQPRRATSTP